MRRRATLLALLLTCTSAIAAAQDSANGGADKPSAPASKSGESGGLPAALMPRVTSTLAKNAIAVGEIATLTIEVDAPTAVEVSLPEQPFGGLELADRRMRSEVVGDRTRTTYELDLLALGAADIELPALLLRLVGPNGELGSARTQPKKLKVSSLIANEPNAEPKPATKPLTVMRDDYTLAWVGGGILAIGLIALATLLIARWLRRRPKPVAPPPPPRPAWELALERLQALDRERDHLFAEQRGELFIDGVSDALREYLGRRYGFDGLERTTSELMATLEQLRPHKLSLSGVALLLEQCDLVKFARVTPDTEQAQDLWNGALGLVRATTPTPSELPPPMLPQREGAP